MACYKGTFVDDSSISCHSSDISWMLLRYPMQTTTRAKLVRLYYELCLIPGIEPCVLRSSANMLSRLLANKQGAKMKLESTDLELP